MTAAQTVSAQLDPALMAARVPLEQIPVIDFAPFLHGSAADRKAVDKFHEAGIKAGAKDNGAPGIRADYSSKYYAAFLIDPDGNNVEAVCT